MNATTILPLITTDDYDDDPFATPMPSDAERAADAAYAEQRNREDATLTMWLREGGSDNLYTNDLVLTLEVMEVA